MEKYALVASGAADRHANYTGVPTLLNKAYKKFDSDNAVRPTIVKFAESWEKKSKPGRPIDETLRSTFQQLVNWT